MGRKEYRTDRIVVSYDAATCIHAAECVKGLPDVFDPEARPWIRPQNASAEEIEKVVARCPSGALQARRLDTSAHDVPPAVTATVMADGPVVLEGACVVRDAQGRILRREAKVALCRCGSSQAKPFCDGTHGKVGFRAP